MFYCDFEKALSPFTQQGKTASEILQVVILCECNIYRRVCSMFSLAKCKVHHAFFTEYATYISILEMGCNLNDDVTIFTRMRRSFFLLYSNQDINGYFLSYLLEFDLKMRSGQVCL